MAVSVVARFLGPPEVEVDGGPLDVDTRKALAVLAVAVVEGPVTRERLATLLWSDSDEKRARAALRRTLSALTAGLGGRAVDADRDRVAVSRTDLWSDVDALRRVAGKADADELLSLRRGTFLDGFVLRGAASFDAWVRDTARELDRLVAHGLDRHIDRAAQANEWGEAERLAQARLDLDPLRERTHRQLIWLAARRGDRDEASARHRRCVVFLQQELGVAPDPATTAVFEQAMAGTPSAWHGEAQPRPRTGRLPHAPGVLVGRGEALEIVDTALDRHDSTLLLIDGVPGIGKTRLLTELARRATDRGRVVAATAAYDDERQVPFAPVVDLLRQLDPPSTPAVATVASDLAPSIEPMRLDSHADRARLLAGLWEALTTKPGTVLLIDDVHWADDSTRELLALAARSQVTDGVVVGLGRRPVGLGNLDLALSDSVVRIERPPLPPLDEGAIAELAARRGVTVDVSEVVEETGGIPMLVTAALDGGPGGIEEAVDRMLRGVGETERQVLSTLAVAGRPVSSDVLAVVAARDEDELAAALDALRALGIVAVEGDRLTVSHSLVRDVLVERAGPVRRRALHRRYAEHLRGRLGEEALLARHLAAAGDLSGAAGAHVAAAAGAMSVGAWEESVHHLEQALANDHPEASRLQAELGDLEVRLGRYESALTSYAAAAATARDDRSRALVEHRIGQVHLRRGAWEAARVHLQAARAGLAGSVSVEVDLALLAAHLGDDVEGAARAQTALEAATDEGDVDGAMAARNALGLLARRGGNAEIAVEHLEAGLDLAVAAPSQRLTLLNNLALALADLGSTDEAREAFDEALSLAGERGDVHREAAVLNNLADLEHGEGNQARARELQRRSLALFAQVGGDRPDPEVWRLVDW